MVAGPYGHGSRTEAERAENLRRLNEAALEVLRRGHLPVIGVNLALPMIEADPAEDAFERIMMPVSLSLSERCDAVLRVGGASAGADAEVEAITRRGGRVFRSIDEIPAL